MKLIMAVELDIRRVSFYSTNRYKTPRIYKLNFTSSSTSKP